MAAACRSSSSRLIATDVAARRLAFTTDLAGVVAGADVIFIAVCTPSRRGHGYADLHCFVAATKEIAAAVTGSIVVVNKSTVPVGTGNRVEAIVREARVEMAIAAVSNSECLRESAAIGDFGCLDRIVIGTKDETARKLCAASIVRAT